MVEVHSRLFGWFMWLKSSTKDSNSLQETDRQAKQTNPDSEDGDVDTLLKVNVDQVWLTGGEWR